MVFSFNYSPREGTRAASMDNQISDEVKKVRMSELLSVQCEISREINETLVDTVQRIIVDGAEEKGGETLYFGRTAGNKLVHFKADENCIGQFVKVKIKRAGAFDLFADIERE